MSNQHQNKLKILGDKAGNLVFEVGNKTFFAVPLSEKSTITPELAIKSISKGSTLLNPSQVFIKQKKNYSTLNTVLGVSVAATFGLVAVANPILAGAIGSAIAHAIKLDNSQEEKTLKDRTIKLNPQYFLRQISQEITKEGFALIYFNKYISENKNNLIPYILVNVIKLEAREKIYKLSITANSSEENKKNHYIVVERFKKSPDWIVGLDALDASGKSTYLIVSKDVKKSLAEIKNNLFITKTFTQAIQGDFSGE